MALYSFKLGQKNIPISAREARLGTQSKGLGQAVASSQSSISSTPQDVSLKLWRPLPRGWHLVFSEEIPEAHGPSLAGDAFSTRHQGDIYNECS